MRTATEATGSNLAPYAEIALAAWRGDETAASVLIESIMRDAATRGEGVVLANSAWAHRVLAGDLAEGGPGAGSSAGGDAASDR